MTEATKIILNKNRGWRGLAELICTNNEAKIIHRMIFSFSQSVWNDLLLGHIVTQDNDNYYVISFDHTEKLPRADQQRSVLIKNFMANITNIHVQPKYKPLSISSDYYELIVDFKKNKNNHTTSDWNCIGVRVTPNI